MACGTALTASRKKTGAVKMKGYRAISFAPFDTTNLIIESSPGIVSDLPAGLTSIYRFEVKNTANNFIENYAEDENSMTGNIVGTGTFSLMYCEELKTVLDVKALRSGFWNVFFELNDGSILVAGIENGARLKTTVRSTDAQGFLCTIETMEAKDSSTLTTVALTDYGSAIVTYA